ncbi:hypothetical protein LTR16_009549, partial [Cryomyces antarcticus]
PGEANIDPRLLGAASARQGDAPSHFALDQGHGFPPQPQYHNEPHYRQQFDHLNHPSAPAAPHLLQVNDNNNNVCPPPFMSSGPMSPMLLPDNAAIFAAMKQKRESVFEHAIEDLEAAKARASMEGGSLDFSQAWEDAWGMLRRDLALL